MCDCVDCCGFCRESVLLFYKKLEKYIDKKLDYSSECIAVALLSLEEARLSFLEAVDAQMKYDEEYSD